MRPSYKPTGDGDGQGDTEIAAGSLFHGDKHYHHGVGILWDAGGGGVGRNVIYDGLEKWCLAASWWGGQGQSLTRWRW